MTATLTERYIAAVTKTLNPTAQDDVRVELEASIADAVDARLEQGQTQEDAERTVLTELGDPAALAAGFADRPLHLIGPRYYLTWWRLLKLLLIIVPVSVAGAVALGQAIAGGNIGETIGSAIGIGLSVAVHIAFWVTLVFAVLERTGADTGVRWDVDQLPEPQAKEAPRTELITSLAYLVIVTGAVLWDHFRGFFPTGGEPIAILNPELWPWWIGGLFVLLAAEVVLAIAVYGNKSWNRGLAIFNTALAVLFVSWWLTLLGRGDLINPEFIDFAFTGAVDEDALRILAILTGFAAVGIAVWDSIDGWRKARRTAAQA
ncbi:permease prefix domain 1-containing protein [Microbacterium sp. A94]|uniref:permease prefix domain 1-containing protein n=1 Tax=Microbacterium sp. A94 TaxID=3450717 RepID=UPI003F41EB4A